jgi:hypothetical protein
MRRSSRSVRLTRTERPRRQTKTESLESNDSARSNPSPASLPGGIFELSTSPHFPAWLAPQRASLAFTAYLTLRSLPLGRASSSPEVWIATIESGLVAKKITE